MIGGAIAFVDKLDTSGFSGLGGAQSVSPTAGEAGSPLAAGGVVTGLDGRAGSAVGGSGVTITLFKNGSATAATCTITSGGTSCTDSTHSVTFSTGDLIAVQIQNASASFVRMVRWSAALATS